jgi:hypothetical protein
LDKSKKPKRNIKNCAVKRKNKKAIKVLFRGRLDNSYIIRKEVVLEDRG